MTSLRQKYKASRSNQAALASANNNNNSSGNTTSNSNRKQQQRDQHLSLLANRSPPPSPSPFALQQHQHHHHQDPNVSALFPGVATVHPVDSFDAAMMMAVESSSVVSSPPKAAAATNINTRLPPQNRFLPQHQPKGGPAYEPEEYCPTEGALQFVPAYAEATTTITTTSTSPVSRMVTNSEDDDDDDDVDDDDDFLRHNKHYDDGHKHYDDNDDNDDHSASWGAITEEKKTASPVPHETEAAIFRRTLARRGGGSTAGKSQPNAVRTSHSHAGVADRWCTPSFRQPDPENDKDRTSSHAADETASAYSSSRPTARGPRMARLASLFASRAVVKGGAPAAASPLTTTTNNIMPTSQRKTPGTKNKRGNNDDDDPMVKSTPHHQPPSPSRSSMSGSTSSGYVAWPGTQDKKGKLVDIQQSYDDSSVGAPAFHRKDLDDPSAEWMLNDNATHTSLDDSLGSSAPSAFLNNNNNNNRLTRSAPRPRTTTTRLSPPRSSVDHLSSTVFREEDQDADYHLAAIAVDGSSSPMMMMSPPSSVIHHRVSRPRVYNMATDPKLTQPAAQRTMMAPLTTATAAARPQPYQRSTSVNSRVGGASGGGGAASSVVATSVASTAISIQNLFHHSEQRLATGEEAAEPNAEFDPWDVDNSSHPPSSPGTSISRGSSAYFGTTNHIDSDFPYSGNKLSMEPTNAATTASAYGVRTNVRGAASVMRRKADPQPPTEDTLALNDHFSPPHRSFNSPGYPGFLDKTKDVPNLMDVVDSDSLTSSKANSTFSSAPQSNSGAPNTTNYSLSARRRHDLNSENRLRVNIENDDDSDVFEGVTPQSGADGGSDVFDGVSNNGQRAYLAAAAARRKHERKATSKSQDELNLVLIGGGLTAIQTPTSDYRNRGTASDFDDNLTNSEIDQYGFTKVPGFQDMARAGHKITDSMSPDSSYGPTFEPGETPRAPTVTVPVRRPVHTPEEQAKLQSAQKGAADTSFGGESESGSSLFSDPYPDEQPGFGRFFFGDLSQYYVQPNDVKKIIRKFRRMCRVQSMDLTVEEMEREEDAKKAFALFEMRSRIMETDIDRGLERQGGTTVVDDLVLTPYNLKAQRIRDAVIVSKAWRDGASPKDVVNSALLTCRAEKTYYIQRPVRDNRSPRGSFEWEEVQWLDDTDFILYRCPSLGPRHLRGFEMFTIGDCQSILLKLTNERCVVRLEFAAPCVSTFSKLKLFPITGIAF